MPDGDRYLWVHRRAPARGRGPGRGGAPRVIGRRPASPLLVRDANRKARSVGSGPGQVVVLSRYAARSLPLAGQAGLTTRSEEHTSELQSLAYLVCRLLLEKKNTYIDNM